MSYKEHPFQKMAMFSIEKFVFIPRRAQGHECLNSTEWLTHYFQLNYRTTTVSRAGDGGGSDDVHLPLVRPDEGAATWQEMSTAVDSVGCHTSIKRLNALNKMIECHVSCGRVK